MEAFCEYLLNKGRDCLNQNDGKQAYFFLRIADYFYDGSAGKNGTDCEKLEGSFGELSFADRPLSAAKLFYWTWIRKNQCETSFIQTQTHNLAENFFQLVYAASTGTGIPPSIRQTTFQLIFDVIQYFYLLEKGDNSTEDHIYTLISDYAKLREHLRKEFRLDVAICGIGEKTPYIKDILSPESVNLKGYISDNVKEDFAGSVPVLLSDTVQQNAFDFFIMAESADAARLTVHEKCSLIDYESYWNDIFCDNHNWSVYLNSMEKLAGCEGLITGISYGLRGIDVRFFSKNFCNLAASGQDLYFDFALLKDALKQSKNLRYCIINLSKFSFEYDLSLSVQKRMIPFYYYRTSCVNHCSDPAKRQSVDHIRSFETAVFTENHTVRFASNYRSICEQDLYLYNSEVYNSSALDDSSRAEQIAEIEKDYNKNYPSTVRDNLDILRQMLDLLKANHIKPIVVVCPVTEFYRAYMGGDRIITEFEREVLSFQQQYRFQYLNYFDSDLFDESDFRDYSHMNHKGAEKLTRILDMEIDWR